MPIGIIAYGCMHFVRTVILRYECTIRSSYDRSAVAVVSTCLRLLLYVE